MTSIQLPPHLSYRTSRTAAKRHPLIHETGDGLIPGAVQPDQCVSTEHIACAAQPNRDSLAIASAFACNKCYIHSARFTRYIYFCDVHSCIFLPEERVDGYTVLKIQRQFSIWANTTTAGVDRPNYESLERSLSSTQHSRAAAAQGKQKKRKKVWCHMSRSDMYQVNAGNAIAPHLLHHAYTGLAHSYGEPACSATTWICPSGAQQQWRHMSMAPTKQPLGEDRHVCV